MHLLGLVLPPFLFVFLHLSPAFAQSNAAIVTSSTSPELNKYPTSTPIPSNTFQPWVYHFSNKTRSKTAATEFNISPSALSIVQNVGGELDEELPEGSLEPLRGAIAMAQITISTQDQNSVTSSPIFTAPQSSGSPVIDNTVTQSTSSIFHLASSSSNLAVTVIQPPNNPVAQYTSAVGLANAILAGMPILPLEVSAPPGKVANSAIESGGNGIEVVQIFLITTLIVSTVSSVPAAATSAVEGPIVLISAGTGIIPSGKSATLGASANSAIPSGGSVGGGDKGGGGGNRSSVITGSGSTTGSGNPTESVSGHTTVPIVSTGGAEGVTRCDSWWLKFEMLVWGLGMVYWM